MVSSLRTGELLIFNAASHKELKRLKLGKGAAHILVDEPRGRAFVSCTPDNFVAVVDLDTLEVTGHLHVGGRPDGMDWAVRGPP